MSTHINWTAIRPIQEHTERHYVVGGRYGYSAVDERRCCARPCGRRDIHGDGIGPNSPQHKGART